MPASSRSRITVPSVAITSVDAWNLDAMAVRRRSDHIAVCETCSGERKVQCGACDGTGADLCGTCGGRRKAYGYATDGSRRLLNCISCRGKGTIDCIHCRRGIASCATCDGEGRVQRWIELEAWERSPASVHPDWIAHQLGWDSNPVNDRMKRDGDMIADLEEPRRLTPGDIGTIPAQWLDRLSSALQPGERIVRQRLRIMRIPSSTIRYRLAGDEDRVTFTGRRLIVRTYGVSTAFERRAAKLRRIRWLVAAIAAIAIIVAGGLLYV